MGISDLVKLDFKIEPIFATSKVVKSGSIIIILLLTPGGNPIKDILSKNCLDLFDITLRPLGYCLKI